MSCFLAITGRSLAATIMGIGLSVVPVAAQDFPSRAISLVVPFPPGGHLDVTGRIFAKRLGESLGQTIVVENRPGASGTIGAGAVARAAADGYTILLAPNSLAIADTLLANIPYRLTGDLEPISMLTRYPYVLSATGGFPADNFEELVIYARENPGVSLATMGAGTANHLTLELLNNRTGANLLHVPYQAPGEALADAIRGRVQLMIVPYVNVEQQLASGDLKALAVTTADRAAFLPDTQSFSDISELDGIDVRGWAAIFAPAGTPGDVLAVYTEAIEEISLDPEFTAAMAEINVDIDFMSGEPLREFVQDEIEFWHQVIEDADIPQQ